MFTMRFAERAVARACELARPAPMLRSGLPLRRPMLVLSLLALAGCGTDSDRVPTAPQGIVTDLTDPAAVLEGHAEALGTRDFAAYAALLEMAPGSRAEAGFQFYPPGGDEDFPWTQGEPWAREEELEIVGHMCDPAFVSSATGASIKSIDAAVSILSQETLASGEIRVTARFLVTVLWGTNDGARCDSPLLFLLAEDGDGFLRIREIREGTEFGRVGSLWWAGLKGLFR
ncbi:MAG: hypothetical protein R3B81_19715 [bacterium]